ncbi:MAG: hypothetical protein E3J37_07250 [Anaerolineales bacterium]|nr:MAG: hypothetical protein E3J37_07250 [Anaerolineales bacterium]
MSSIIKVVKGTTEISLLDTGGFNLQMRGWNMAPAEREAGVVRERISCNLIATDPDDAASQFQTLNDLLRDAVLYSENDPVQNVPVYIETQYEDETNKRYALIAGDYARFKVSPFDYIAKTHHVFRSIDLVITRAHPWSSHKPGILPGRIQLDETDGPDYSPSQTDFDIDLVSTFGHHPTTMTGGLIGRPGKFGRGAQVAQVVENIVANPSFETNTTGWSAGGANTVAQDAVRYRYGAKSLKCTWQDNSVLAYYPITLTAAAHTLGMWMYIPTSYDGGGVKIYLADFAGAGSSVIGNADMDVRDEWQFIPAHLTPVGGDLVGAIYVERSVSNPSAGRFIYIDAVQVEARNQPTCYCDGSLGPGHSWQGVAHASKSDRVASELAFDDDAATLINSQMTVMGWIEHSDPNYQICMFDMWESDPKKIACIRQTDHEFDLYLNGAYRIQSIGSGTEPEFGDWTFWCVTLDYDEDDYNLYVLDPTDGVMYSGNDTTALDISVPTLFKIGTDRHTALKCNSVFDEFIIIHRVLSAAEIQDYVDSGKPFVGDPELKLYLPFDGPRWDHIANFRDDVEIDEIYNKVDGDGWSANFAAEEEFTLFPNAVAQDDFVLVGSTDQPLKHVIFNFRTAGDLTDTTLVLEYWNTDPAWTALVINEDYAVYPGATLEEMLESKGNAVISMIPPSDYLKVDPGTGTDAYCLRIRESHANPVYATHPIHAGQLAYAARKNEIRIPAASLHGDAPPKVLLRLHADGGGDADPGFARLSRIVWGIKSKGLTGFTSNLNAGNQDNPAGWAVTYGADSSSSLDPSGPGGYSNAITFAGGDALAIRTTFTGTNKTQYWLGNYRVYVICRQTGGATGQTSLRLRTFLEGVNDYDPHVDSATVPLVGVAVGYEALDMGELNIPFGPYSSEGVFSATDLIFQLFASRVAASGATLRIHALVLMPIDQASGTPNDTTGAVPGSGFALIGGQAIDHDGGVVERGTNKVVMAGVNHHSVMSWDSGGAFIEINRLAVASRIYFLLLHYPLGGSWGTGPMIASPGCHLVGELQLHHSYRLLRGND